MKKMLTFDDGTRIEWVDRETIRYSFGNHSALVWVDYEPGLFNRGRIMKSLSITNWESPASPTSAIDSPEKQRIIEAVKKYYSLQGINCRVE